MAEVHRSRRAEAPEALPSLEAFPVFKPASRSLVSNKIVAFDNGDLRSRPFNLLRTRLAKALQEQQAPLVGLTSATPGAGKSFLSLNLAVALARLGDRPVFLVDLDLRRASLAEQLGMRIETGVDDFLSGEVHSLEELGHRIEGLPLVVFPTKLVRSNSAEALTGQRFSQLVDLLRQRTDNPIVLFDLPPVFANDDAMICIEALDGYILIVDSGRTTRRQVVDAMEMLAPASCLGSIMNRYKGGVADTYGYYSGLYNRYYDK